MPDSEHTFPEGFAWDEAKRRANQDKHGIDFIDALAVRWLCRRRAGPKARLW